MKRKLLLPLFVVTSTMLACSLGSTPTPSATLPVPAATAPVSTAPTRTVVGLASKPTWWPLEVPDDAVLTSGEKAPALWRMADPNVDGITDVVVSKATAAGYQVHVIALSQGAIYDLLLIKGNVCYTLNITRGSEATILTGDRTGILHLQMKGASTQTVDLPLRERLNLTPGSEVSIGTAIPNSQCATCQHYINIHIAPFNGPGNYVSRPAGIYIIDVELIPGGTEIKDDYRWAKQCSVNVQDASSGNFACSGLENVSDNTKVIDISGSWQQPVAP